MFYVSIKGITQTMSAIQLKMQAIHKIEEELFYIMDKLAHIPDTWQEIMRIKEYTLKLEHYRKRMSRIVVYLNTISFYFSDCERDVIEECEDSVMYKKDKSVGFIKLDKVEALMSNFDTSGWFINVERK